MEIASGMGTIAVGILLIVISIFNMCGNVSMLHSYHIKNVKEEDKLAFGRLIGIGMMLIGLSIVLLGVMLIISFKFDVGSLAIISHILTGVLTVIGLVIMFIAMKIYNKGIF